MVTIKGIGVLRDIKKHYPGLNRRSNLAFGDFDNYVEVIIIQPPRLEARDYSPQVSKMAEGRKRIPVEKFDGLDPYVGHVSIKVAYDPESDTLWVNTKDFTREELTDSLKHI